ncbi:hypothetical protein SAM_0128 [Streptococcus agalactiae CJB111]|nr:hypothetical protein SAJ_0206 [Streptococcus agalactiae 18RS21]EAO73105.1 hypothetical protein SAM_0128 [Streptococcus agalactiae CJB111]EPU20529.1 hypothetical protein SAG0137_01280 [Streptococcus agalactiae LMG 14838]
MSAFARLAKVANNRVTAEAAVKTLILSFIIKSFQR